MISFVAGTRPELIKIGPVMLRLSQDFEVCLFFTGQHQDLATPLLPTEVPVYPIVTRGLDSLADRFANYVREISALIEAKKPELIFVQGDTISASAGAHAASLNGIMIAHLEAGLRTHDSLDPWPEEILRRNITALADIHFAPTYVSASNLDNEGVSKDSTHIVGNSVIDSIAFLEKSRAGSARNRSARSVLVTLHRRESAGQTRRRALSRILALAKEKPEIEFSLVSHPNPSVLEDFESVRTIFPSNVRVVQPLPYEVFLDKFRSAACLISDSGGVQEEGPTLGTPVLIARNNTERPEGISSGHNFLIGADASGIFKGWEWLSSRRSPDTVNPFGEGSTSEKVASIVSQVIRQQ